MHITQTIASAAALLILGILALVLLVKLMLAKSITGGIALKNKNKAGIIVMAIIFALMLIGFVFGEILYITTVGWICIILIPPMFVLYAAIN